MPRARSAARQQAIESYINQRTARIRQAMGTSPLRAASAIRTATDNASEAVREGDPGRGTSGSIRRQILTGRPAPA